MYAFATNVIESLHSTHHKIIRIIIIFMEFLLVFISRIRIFVVSKIISSSWHQSSPHLLSRVTCRPGIRYSWPNRIHRGYQTFLWKTLWHCVTFLHSTGNPVVEAISVNLNDHIVLQPHTYSRSMDIHTPVTMRRDEGVRSLQPR